MAQEPHTIDLLPKPSAVMSERGARTKIRFFMRCLSFGTVALVIVAGFVSTRIARTTAEEPVETKGFSLFSSFRRLVSAPDKTLSGESDDRINLLLLGIGGAGHEGPELTDTIIFSSYRPSTNEVGMVSVPRDLTVNIPYYGYRKINAVNALAEANAAGSGAEATANMVETMFGQTVDYTVKVDFHGFEEIIDDVGGVNVYVEQSFTDATYPVDDGEGHVTTVTFTQGWTLMDGKTALMFARSRHGDHGEGSDFARAARQQKILLALKDRVLSLNVLLNPSKLNRMISTIRENVHTNISLWEMVRLAQYIPQIDTQAMVMHVLDTAPESPLYSTMMNDAYVILPRHEDWSDLHLIADNIFQTTVEGLSKVAALPESPKEAGGVSVEIQNGTMTTGLAARTAELLASSGFTIATVSNAEVRDYRKTIIYDYTNGRKAEELASLQGYLRADVVMTPQGYLSSDAVIPDVLGGVPQASSGDIDFLIIIGENGSEVVML